MFIVAGAIAGLGVVLCFVGVFFTSMLAIAFMGGFVVWYAGRAGPPPEPALRDRAASSQPS